MDAPSPPPPAIVEFVKQADQYDAGWCEWRTSGYHITVGTWPEEVTDLIQLFNEIPLESLSLVELAISDRHFKLFRNVEGLMSISVTSVPIDGSGLDLLPVCEAVTEVDISGCPLDGRKMIGMRKFPNASDVKLKADFADDAVRHLKPLANLEILSLYDCKMTGDGLEGLAGKQHLRKLYLHGAGMKSGPQRDILRGFQHLASCPSLEGINLEETSVDDAGLADIAKIKSLQSLSVGSDKITDDGLRHFAGHPNLRSLSYCGKGWGWMHLGVTEKCFVHLPNIPNLRSLSVCCNITTEGLKSLKQIPKLESLRVDWPTMTQTELNELRKQLPNCRVTSIYLIDSRWR